MTTNETCGCALNPKSAAAGTRSPEEITARPSCLRGKGVTKVFGMRGFRLEYGS